jgi:site-specific recombinase XerD
LIEFSYAKDHTPSSRQWYHSRLGAFITWTQQQGVEDLEAITAPLIRRYLDMRRTAISRTGRPLDSHTLHGHARAIRAFLRWAVKEDLLDERVPKRVEMPKREQKLMTVFSPEQIEALFRACDQSETPAQVARDRAILATLLDTGIRAQELCGLTLDRLVFTPDEAYFVVNGKGRKQREVGLGARARRLLHRYVHTHRQASRDVTGVFLGKGGQPLTPEGLDRLLYRLRDRAGREQFAGVRVSAHTFRHTYATCYLEQGGDIYHLSRLMGHTSVLVTEGYLKAVEAKVARRGPSVFDPHSAAVSEAFVPFLVA